MTEQLSTQVDARVDPTAKSRARKAVAMYGLDRLLLFIGLTVVIQLLSLIHI